MKRDSMKRRAFTLVELLVVVGVLALIVALLFPGHHGRRENPRKSACQNNLKQIALCFKQYQNDFDAHYPLFMVTTGSSTGTPPYGWADALQPYIKNAAIYQCPADVLTGTDDPTKSGSNDYFYNANFMVFSKGKWTGAPETMLGAPSQTILVGERWTEIDIATNDARSNFCGDGKWLSKFGQRCAQSPSDIAILPSAQAHLDGSNLAFADGHVKWYRGNLPTQSAQVLNNGVTKKTIAQKANAGKSTFSLLSR